MDDTFPFASRDYFLLLLLLIFARGMDFLSTWIATPNLVLEGNPLAKKLGWKWGLLLNVVLVGVLARWPLSAIVVATASVLVAARNFQSAWLMHSLGEENYRRWHVERVQETRITLYLFCLAGNTLLTAGVGAALIYFSQLRLVPFRHWHGHGGLCGGRGVLHAAGDLADPARGKKAGRAAKRVHRMAKYWRLNPGRAWKTARRTKSFNPCTHRPRMNF